MNKCVTLLVRILSIGRIFSKQKGSRSHVTGYRIPFDWVMLNWPVHERRQKPAE